MKKRTLVRSWSKKDFRIDFFRGSGAGGQHRNKRDTACRITDIETGLSSESQEQRSKEQNKKVAFQKLAAKLMDHHYPKIPKERAPVTERVRTYHEPRNIVTDHRTTKSYPWPEVMDGKGIDRIIEDVILIGRSGVSVK